MAALAAPGTGRVGPLSRAAPRSHRFLKQAGRGCSPGNGPRLYGPTSFGAEEDPAVGVDDVPVDLCPCQ
jgi:hypothetical protein